MQSNPMELIETLIQLRRKLGLAAIRLNSRRRRRARGVATCVIIHWKQMTNVNVFTNVIHPHQKSCGVFQRLSSILGLNLSC